MPLHEAASKLNGDAAVASLNFAEEIMINLPTTFEDVCAMDICVGPMDSFTWRMILASHLEQPRKGANS